MNMKEIAKMAGVSVATVSYVLNGTGNVSEKKRKEILEIVGKEGYHPNRIAKSLRTKKTSTLGIMVEDITAFQTPRIINGINQYAEKNGYTLILNDMSFLKRVGKNFESIRKFSGIIRKELELFEKAQVDGIIYVALHDRNMSDFIPVSNVPVVLVYCYDITHQNYCVTYDNIDISKKAALYFVEKGHRDFGIICGLEGSRPAQKRYSAFIEQLEDSGMNTTDIWTYTGDWEFGSGKEAYAEYRKLRKKPTAVFAMNDLMAAGFMDAALDDHKRIPEDISVIGFDNRQECRFTRPRLTTVDIPLELMGQEAGRLILQLIQGRKEVEKKIILPCSFIEKKSAAEVKKKEETL